MKHDEYELLSVNEMKKKYGLYVANRPEIHLDPKAVPNNLRHLIPLAEIWGIGDDLIRDDLIRNSPYEAIVELKRIIEKHEDSLDEWLAGPEAESDNPSDEYLAFSAMRMAADFTI